MVASLASISANAVTPDQLLPYVRAVSGLESAPIGDCVLHYGGGHGVLVAYGLKNPLDLAAMNAAVRDALQFPQLEKLTVLGPARPDLAPVDAQGQRDTYWQITAAQANAKLRNLLKRASRDLTVKADRGKKCWTEQHQALAWDFCARKQAELDQGTCYLFEKLGAYLADAPEAELFSAYNPKGELDAFAIGDYTSLSTAFYMFAARKAQATPGAADLLLLRLVNEAKARGHAQVNLGLGINGGIEFFKKKWGASPFLPYVETSWTLTAKPNRKTFWGRLFGKKLFSSDSSFVVRDLGLQAE